MTSISIKQKVESAVFATDKLPLMQELIELTESDDSQHYGLDYYGLLFDCSAAQIRDNWPELFEAWAEDYDVSSIVGKQLRELKASAVTKVTDAFGIGTNEAKFKVDEYLSQELEILKDRLGDPQVRTL